MKIATGARKEEKKKEYCVYIYLYTNIQNSNTYNTNKKNHDTIAVFGRYIA